ncbi:hypothetical protein CN445_10920 [Bacillus cereus]|uniref:hypothetical protein n=1 Tax=Bacillus nitratireducens TaxID=2026193 RepID=UPI0002D548AB|nr:hypothetical protein [Bacillus nitratireducens]PEW87923.1 hypothetical protein CN445_10920 [Bacillus cereus]OJD39248.1 hypothetical protein BAU23_01110 [Bacillus nitratireducens]PEX44920.1 hypothetical protein CN464_19820 [Bacillus cereus]PFJ75318.1 hypothetical protein COI95_21460 [Bacillus cereus]
MSFLVVFSNVGCYIILIDYMLLILQQQELDEVLEVCPSSFILAGIVLFIMFCPDSLNISKKI